MRIDVATAALDDETEQRVRISLSLLSAYRVNAIARNWDGTRCHLLIVDVADGIGRNALTTAIKRGTPTLIMGTGNEIAPEGVRVIAANSTARAIAEQIQAMLAARQVGPVRKRSDVETVPVLCQLTDAKFAGKSVDLVKGSRRVGIRPGPGRVYARTHADLISAREGLGTGDWTIEIVNESVEDYLLSAVSSSSEAFLLQGALDGRNQLPQIVDRRYRIKHWPDLGNVPASIVALKLAASLLKAPTSYTDLVQRDPADRNEINAALWAYRASGLLIDAETSTESSRTRRKSAGPAQHLLRRIARRFGLFAE